MSLYDLAARPETSVVVLLVLGYCLYRWWTTDPINALLEPAAKEPPTPLARKVADAEFYAELNKLLLALRNVTKPSPPVAPLPKPTVEQVLQAAMQAVKDGKGVRIEIAGDATSLSAWPGPVGGELTVINPRGTPIELLQKGYGVG